ncbi:hypothetical protein MMPV_000059 [Pyropia vietnamensis]
MNPYGPAESSDTEDGTGDAPHVHPTIRWLHTMADVYNDGNVRKTMRALLEYASAQWDMEAVLRSVGADAVAATDADLATFDGIISKAHGDWLSRMAVRYGLSSGAAALLRLLAYGAKCEDRAPEIFGMVWLRPTTLTVMGDIGMYTGLLTAEPLSFRLSPKALYCYVEGPRGESCVGRAISGSRWVVYTAGEVWAASRAVALFVRSQLMQWAAGRGGIYTDMLFKRADRYTY